MITRLEFTVELDDLAFERGLEYCVEVTCEYDVSFSYDRFDKPEINFNYTKLKRITDENGLDVTGKLSETDMKKIERYLDKAIDDHDFYDDYIAAEEARAESAMEDQYEINRQEK